MLVTMKSILDHANENNYAVMAINCINMELARAAIEAAEEMHSPIIIQMGPGQMKKHAHPSEMCPMVKAMAERVNIPVCLNLDHGSDFHDIMSAIKNKLLDFPDDTKVYPGHGPSTTIKKEKQVNPFIRQ